MSGLNGDRTIVAAVDDEPFILEAWEEALGDRFDLRVFSDALAAKRHFETEDVDVVLLDVRMPGMDGLRLLEHLKAAQPTAEAIIITGHGTIEMAVRAIQAGAYDFLCKPVYYLTAAIRRVESAVERKRLRETNARLQSRLEAYGPETELIGVSRTLTQVRSLIDQIADSPAPVLICGESGTGKELAARALHSRSARRDARFVAINCAAIPETLIDSELFGHEKGAFTGAQSTHKGLFEAADGGVLFLDEIGEIPLQTQVRLLRALQEGEVRPVGSTGSRRVDVRVVAATNLNLERAMKDGRFREDLYYRISTFRLNLPPLRDRAEDVPLIAQHLLAKLAKRANRTPPTLGDASLEALTAYHWRGNVRELNNALEHAVTLCDVGPIEPRHLPSFVTAGGRTRGRQSGATEAGAASSVPFSEARKQMLTEFERRYLLDLLTSTTGNLSEASRRSGIDRTNLRRLVKRHGMQTDHFKNQARSA